MTDDDRLQSFAVQLERAHARLRGRLDDVRAALAGPAPDAAPDATGEGAAAAAADLFAHCLAFCAAVRTHHGGEDRGLFAALRADRPDLAGRVDALGEDHRLVAGVLVRVEELVGAARTATGTGAREALVREVDGLAAILTSHFAFEERVVAGWQAGVFPATGTDDGWMRDVLRPEPTPRPTVRVLLLDGTDRLLLFSSRTDDGRPFWFPAGGGVDPGEAPRDAAVRELTEETGWADPVLGPLVGTRRHVARWDGRAWDLSELWYLARVDRLDVDTSGFTAQESAAGLRWRWWTLPELRASTGRFVPADLAGLVGRLLRDGPPSEPLVLGH